MNSETYIVWAEKGSYLNLDAGLGYTIDAKVSVNGSPQYKVHNNKGKIYYITASNEYVHVN